MRRMHGGTCTSLKTAPGFEALSSQTLNPRKAPQSARGTRRAVCGCDLDRQRAVPFSRK
jgi:hypothetical protein